MKRLMSLTAAAAITLAAMPVSMLSAQPRPPEMATCTAKGPQGKPCAQPLQGRQDAKPAAKPGHGAAQPGKPAHGAVSKDHGGQHAQGKPGKPGHAASPAKPRIGASARDARPFQRAQSSRFKEAPRGQEYRVMNEHLVLVDSRNLQVLQVLGLMSALINR